MNKTTQKYSRKASDRLKGSNAGVTIWEVLLVVVGLLVFAAIAIPCPCGYVVKGKATKAVAELRNVELALTKMLLDTGTTDLQAFFDDAAFAAAVERIGEEKSMDAFAASIEVYTYGTYVLLRRGRNAAESLMEHPGLLRPEMVAQLGEVYYEDFGHDPWGNLYQIYPGPWSDERGPIPFRSYLAPAYAGVPGEIASEPDVLTFNCMDLEADREITVGWPAPSNESVYIWSIGANLESGQAIYDPTQIYAGPPLMHYGQFQEPELMGGGDDINSWDTSQSFMRFYQ